MSNADWTTRRLQIPTARIWLIGWTSLNLNSPGSRMSSGSALLGRHRVAFDMFLLCMPDTQVV
jgi:hypothetical protein